MIKLIARKIFQWVVTGIGEIIQKLAHFSLKRCYKQQKSFKI
jgi:hypothetical protein